MIIDDLTGKDFETVTDAKNWKREECKENIANLLSEYNIFTANNFLDWIKKNNLLNKFVKDHQDKVNELIETEVITWSTYTLCDTEAEEEEDEDEIYDLYY